MNKETDPPVARAIAAPHAATLENRRRATLTGVTDVASFNEQEVLLHTGEGEVSILGEGLHIAHLNLDEGKLTVEGRLLGLEYGDAPAAKKTGLFGRLFR